MGNSISIDDELQSIYNFIIFMLEDEHILSLGILMLIWKYL
jgi:hypothetical protein